ncbi:hypothetical protein [Salibacterium lacus]|uniref:Uncharacterized protein n=1 Tax=Salibacterium lacus TaxID=1898109 RepID=A0ABW5T4T6_9BACI
MQQQMFFLITYWIMVAIGLASFYYTFMDYGFGITVLITVVTGTSAALLANALRNRLLIMLAVLLFFSSLIFIGIISIDDLVAAFIVEGK